MMAVSRVSRRLAVGGLAALIAACAALPPLSLDAAVRRLLMRATQRALARFDAPGGGWDRLVAGLDLAELGPAGMMLQRALTSPEFHRRLDGWLRPAALRAAHAAAPRIVAAIKVIGVAKARAVLAGGPHAATDLLRSDMGPAVIEAMVPEIRGAVRLLNDPVLRPVIAALAMLAGDALVRRIAQRAENTLWAMIGDEEAALRADPAAGGDPQLAAILAHR